MPADRPARDRFRSYRRGWCHGAGVMTVDQDDQSEDYSRGFQEGRDANSAALAAERERLGLPPSGWVQASENSPEDVDEGSGCSCCEHLRPCRDNVRFGGCEGLTCADHALRPTPVR